MQLLVDPPIVPATKVIHEPNYYKILTTDPRPDLNDTETWMKLLPKIVRTNEFKAQFNFNFKALSCLHTVRHVGTMLKWDMNAGYKLKPLYDFGNWDNLEYWEDTKQRHLLQYANIYREWFYLIDH